MIRFLAFMILLATIIAIASCGTEETATLSSDERKLVDSLYRKRVSKVRKEADSLCDVRYKSIFDRASDSIKQTYVEEIYQILEER